MMTRRAFSIIKDIDLAIKRNTSVALIGQTGVGKATLVDIILGLLLTQKGHLLVDENIINHTNLAQ